METAGRSSITAGKTSSAPSSQRAGSFTDSSLNPSAETRKLPTDSPDEPNPSAQAPYATDPVGGCGKPRRADRQAPLEPNCLLYLQNAGLRPQMSDQPGPGRRSWRSWYQRTPICCDLRVAATAFSS